MAERHKDELESRRILERVGAETEARMRPPGKGVMNEADWPELWGRRIGRVLSVVLLFVAVIWIYQYLTEAG